jgi:hypothetical protein
VAMRKEVISIMKRKLALVAGILLSLNSAKAVQKPKVNWKAVTADISLSATDVVTSEMIYNRGGHEVWSKWEYGYRPSPAKLSLMMAAEVAACELGAYELDKLHYPKLAKAAHILRLGGEGAAVINNSLWLRTR